MPKHADCPLEGGFVEWMDSHRVTATSVIRGDFKSKAQRRRHIIEQTVLHFRQADTLDKLLRVLKRVRGLLRSTDTAKARHRQAVAWMAPWWAETVRRIAGNAGLRKLPRPKLWAKNSIPQELGESKCRELSPAQLKTVVGWLDNAIELIEGCHWRGRQLVVRTPRQRRADDLRWLRACKRQAMEEWRGLVKFLAVHDRIDKGLVSGALRAMLSGVLIKHDEPWSRDALIFDRCCALLEESGPEICRREGVVPERDGAPEVALECWKWLVIYDEVDKSVPDLIERKQESDSERWSRLLAENRFAVYEVVFSEMRSVVLGYSRASGVRVSGDCRKHFEQLAKAHDPVKNFLQLLRATSEKAQKNPR